MKKMNEYMEEAEQVVLHTYNRFPVVLDKGEGVYLTDTEGKNIWISVQESLCLPWDTTIRITMKP